MAGERVHFWPFDGRELPTDRSVVPEVYPAIWSARYPRGDRTPDQHDAFTVAAHPQRCDRGGGLERLLQPDLTADEIKQASIEGWIAGVE